MSRYETPEEIARLLAQHGPRRASSLLDPAVGTGVLVKPLVARFAKSLRELVCIDTDSRILRPLRRTLGPTAGYNLRFVHGDFLEWSDGAQSGLREGFDCVVMNPPFGGRQGDMVSVDLANEFPSAGQGTHFAPIEAAFVTRALGLLRPGGRLLAVLPSTLITGLGTIWLRQLMLEMGSPLLVHELPRGTFKGVDASVFLLVYGKASRQAELTLCNSDLARPDRIVVHRSSLFPHLRMDYKFHKATLWYEAVRANFPALGWTRLDGVAEVYRGTVESPVRSSRVLHSVDRHDGFWRLGCSKMTPHRFCEPVTARPGDLILPRVGRRCSQYVGLYAGAGAVKCSDCVFVIRPKKAVPATTILLAMRVVLGWDCGSALVESGTAASYIPRPRLLSLAVPIGIRGRWPRLSRLYERAVRQMDAALMKSVETHMRQLLVGSCDSQCPT
jgi:predicted RNA methylase